MWKDKIIAAGLITAFLLTGCASEDKTSAGEVFLYKGETKQQEKTEYETCKVEKKDFVEDITESAELEYTSQDSIVMDIGNVTLDTLDIKAGEKVKKGQVVATYTVDVDEADMERQKLSLESRRKEFNAQLKMKQNALKEFKRQVDAMKEGNDKKIKTIEYEKQKKEFEQFKASEAEIKQSEKDYAGLIADSKKTKLRSKVSGTVTKLGDISEGDALEAGTVIAIVQQSGDFIIKAENSAGALRYNMEVDVWLGGDRNDIRHKFKGTIASADNLTQVGNSAGGGMGQDENTSAAYVKISEKDKKKYNFEKNNVYIHYETKRINDALVAENEAVYSEVDGEDLKMYVYVVVNGNLHKRYIVSTFYNDTVTLIDQGVEEGQLLAKDVVEDKGMGMNGGDVSPKGMD